MKKDCLFDDTYFRIYQFFDIKVTKNDIRVGRYSYERI